MPKDEMKFTLRLSTDLVRKIDEEREKENRSRNNFIETVLIERVERGKK